MKNTIEYKGFIGTVEISEEDGSFGGEVINIKDSHVLYAGNNYNEFMSNFHDVIDDYIEYKTENNEEIVNQYKGSFNVRINPEIHRDAAIFAKQHRTSLNKLVEIAIKEKIYAK